jgi:anaerobic magnesium-protoporphyrin IX monomethyl ester cyclase
MSKPRILYIQHEIYNWHQAKMWSYNLHLGIEPGFIANDIDFFTLTTTWLPKAKEILKGRRFDQVWMNDVLHSHRTGGCGGYQITQQDLEWITQLAPVRLGFINETLEYSDTEYAMNPDLRELKRSLQTTINYFTHLAVIDENDFPAIKELRDIPLLWLVPPMPCASIARQITLPPKTPATFTGTPYGERAKWLQLPNINTLLERRISPDSLTDIPKLFDLLHSGFYNASISQTAMVGELYLQYLHALRKLRHRAFEMYLEGLTVGAAVVHLPSFCKVYNARVYEGIAAGRPVVTVRCNDRPRLNALFKDGEDILLYSDHDPSELISHIKHIHDDPEFGRFVAEKARNKILDQHTVEKWVPQVLHWIETGQEPSYCELKSRHPSSSQKQATGTGPGGQCNIAGNPDELGVKNKKATNARKLRILFVSPPFARLLGLGNCRFPLSFGQMATILSMNGHTAAVYDADFDKRFIGKSATYEQSFRSQGRIVEALNDRQHPVWKEIEKQITDFNPDVVGITTMTSKFPMAMRVAEIAKTLNPDIRVVVGGHHASIFAERIVEDKRVDFAVFGEGELTFLELINRLCDPKPDFSRINGLIYKNGAGIAVNEPRQLLGNLDILPIADRDLIVNDGFFSENNIMTSRGCPFNCSYCGAQVIWKRKVRRRSVPNVMREVRYLLGRSVSRSINFWDDSFTCDRGYTAHITEELQKIDGLNFSCITRLDLVDSQILSQLKKAGCSQILFGVESGNDDILRRIDKKMNREFIKQKTGLVDAAGIPWLGFFIMGYPGETRHNILETLDFMKELNPAFAEINIFNPLPGTKIWNDLEQDGAVSSDMDFSKYSQASTENYFTDGSMSKEEFRELALFMAREFDNHNRSRNGQS